MSDSVCPICHEDNAFEIFLECSGCGTEGLQCCVRGNPPMCPDCYGVELDADDFENEFEEDEEDEYYDDGSDEEIEEGEL